MKYTLAAAFALALSAGLNAAADDAVVGDYVEARTAEVFTGGCIMGSERRPVAGSVVPAPEPFFTYWLGAARKRSRQWVLQK